MRLALALLLLAAPALAASPPLRAPDAVRLEAFDAHLGAALREAFAGGDAPALSVLAAALNGTVAEGALDPAGDWDCRTIKLGGLVPIVAYEDFRCEVAAAGPGAWTLRKLTGSQRLEGTLATLDDGRVRFAGTAHVGARPAAAYDALPPVDQTPVEPGQTVAAVGWFEQVAPDRARLMLPAPILESRFDILWLTR